MSFFVFHHHSDSPVGSSGFLNSRLYQKRYFVLDMNRQLIPTVKYYKTKQDFISGKVCLGQFTIESIETIRSASGNRSPFPPPPSIQLNLIPCFLSLSLLSCVSCLCLIILTCWNPDIRLRHHRVSVLQIPARSERDASKPKNVRSPREDSGIDSGMGGGSQLDGAELAGDRSVPDTEPRGGVYHVLGSVRELVQFR